MKTLYFTEECQLRPTDKSWNSYTRQDLMIGIKTSGEELMENWRLHNDKVTPHRLFLGHKEKTVSLSWRLSVPKHCGKPLLTNDG